MIDELQTQFEQETDPEKQLELRKQIHEELIATKQFEIDFDNLPTQDHKWVDRGLILSCEIGTHPNHRIRKR
jgi:hypothetical protein